MVEKEKTKEDLEIELALLTALNIQREISDERYAMKLVEKVVWGELAIILSAVILALVALVIQ